MTRRRPADRFVGRRPRALACLLACSVAGIAVGSSSAAAGGGSFGISPGVIEFPAHAGQTTTVTISNSSAAAVTVSVIPRPWLQGTSGRLLPNPTATLAAIMTIQGGAHFTLGPGQRHVLTVRLDKVPPGGSQYGALVVTAKPTAPPAAGSGTVVAAYQLDADIRVDATQPRRAVQAGDFTVAASAKTRLLELRIRNHGNTIEPVSGSVTITGPAGGSSTSFSPVQILPGFVVNVAVASLRGLGHGRYKAVVRISQGGRHVATATGHFKL